MKDVCSICGKSNKRTSYKEQLNMILCDSCYKMCQKYKYHYIPPKGEIHYDCDGNIICHICGRSFKKLSVHIKTKHNMDNKTYKEIFGLNRTVSLTGTNFIKNVTTDITKYSANTMFKKGHTKSRKPKRLQALKGKSKTKSY